jgi:hypothetical protein
VSYEWGQQPTLRDISSGAFSFGGPKGFLTPILAVAVIWGVVMRWHDRPVDEWDEDAPNRRKKRWTDRLLRLILPRAMLGNF